MSGDLENGFGDDSETVAETIRLAAAAGLVGGSIEDSTNRPVNVVMGLQGLQRSLAALSEIGAKRVRVGSALFEK